MTTKVEDLTDAELDVLVGETMTIGWSRDDRRWYVPDNLQAGYGGVGMPPGYAHYDIKPFRPSTDIACAFQVDKPEWRWDIEELILYDNNADGHPTLEITLYGYLHQLADIFIPLDLANKAAAYCRGRCIAACYACGITEV